MEKKDFGGLHAAGILAPPPPRHMNPLSVRGFFERQGIKKNYACVNAMIELWNRKSAGYAGLADFLSDIGGDKGLGRLRTFLQETATRHTLAPMDVLALFLRWLMAGNCNPAYQKGYPEFHDEEKLCRFISKELEEKGDLPSGASGAEVSFVEWLGIMVPLPGLLS